jgi:very-short-patch-repair endonuclease
MVDGASEALAMRAPVLNLEGLRRFWRAPSRPEAVLWRALQDRRLAGIEFRRRLPFGPYMLGFYCPTAKLAVEIGETDPARDAWLAALGVRVLRFTPAEILDEGRRVGVLAAIAAAVRPLGQ